MKTIKLKNYDFMNFYIILELQPKSGGSNYKYVEEI